MNQGEGGRAAATQKGQGKYVVHLDLLGTPLPNFNSKCMFVNKSCIAAMF